LDSLSALVTFVRAAEARSFTSAGQQLGLSSSAIGKAIARLEERLGVRLFNRNTRTITLTQEGQRFLETCHRIISEIKTVEQEFVRSRETPKGKLRISLPLVGAFMMSTLGSFMQCYPDIEIDLDFSDERLDVIGGGYDVAIQTGEPADSRLISRSLGTYRFEIVGSPSYFIHAGVPKTPADLTTHACLHYRSATTGKPQRWPLDIPTSGHETDLPTKATASAVGALISLAELGLGIACLPDFSVRRQIDDGSLVSVLKDHLDATEVFRATWPSSKFMSPRLRVFIDFLAENSPTVSCQPIKEKAKIVEGTAPQDAALRADTAPEWRSRRPDTVARPYRAAS
jgi:DNA-binding transcriptional LysR family regulator